MNIVGNDYSFYVCFKIVVDTVEAWRNEWETFLVAMAIVSQDCFVDILDIKEAPWQTIHLTFIRRLFTAWLLTRGDYGCKISLLEVSHLQSVVWTSVSRAAHAGKKSFKDKLVDIKVVFCTNTEGISKHSKALVACVHLDYMRLWLHMVSTITKHQRPLKPRLSSSVNPSKVNPPLR